MSKSARALAFTARLVVEGSAGFIELPCDPREVFGKLRAPVKVTLNGYSYRSTIAAMGGPPCIGVRASHRTAAGLKSGDLIDVLLELDEEKREVTPPADLVKALKTKAGAWDRWRALSFTHQREHVEAIADAKKPDTRARRIAKAVAMVRTMKKKS